MYDRQREAMQVVDAYGCLQQDIELGVRRHLWVFLQTQGQAEGVELRDEGRQGSPRSVPLEIAQGAGDEAASAEGSRG